MVAKKKAVLIGCNYPYTMAELRGCINDVQRMHKCLVERYDFSDDDITLLIDTDESYTQPTGLNIRAALADLVNSARSGDFLFVHYSGHGTRLPVKLGDYDDDTGYDECIVPSDMNLITDDDLRELVDKVPKGCRITIVSDSCHSGGLIDEAKEQIGQSTYMRQLIKEEKEEDRSLEGYFKDKYLSLSTLKELLQQKTGKEDIDVRPTVFGDDASPKVKKSMNVTFGLGKLEESESGGGVVLQNNGGYAEPVWKIETHGVGVSKEKIYTWERGLSDTAILISGCQSNETSTDCCGDPSGAYGALSNAIQTIIAESGGKVTNRQLVRKVRVMLKKQGFAQSPGLYCSDHHVDASFIC